MTKPASQPKITQLVMDRVLSLIAQFFLSATVDIEAATQAARSMLACYNARNDRELYLAALTVAFRLGSMDALSRAVDPELTFNQAMRLRTNAVSLSRAGGKADEALDQAREEPEEDPEPAQAPELPASAEINELVALAKALPPLSRQQRRFAERQAEKLRQRVAEQQRKAELQAKRDQARAAMPANATG